MFFRKFPNLLPLLMLWGGYAGPAQAMGMAEFVAAVVAQHPEGAIDQARIDAAQAATDGVGRLPDPVLAVARPAEPRWEMTLAQTFPWPGSAAAAREDKQNIVYEARGDATLGAAQRAFGAKDLYVRMVRAAKLIAVQQESLKVVEGIRDFMHDTFKEGTGSHMAYLDAQGEAAILSANLGALRTDLLNLKREALLMLGRSPAEDPESLPLTLDWPAAAESPADDQVLARIDRAAASAAGRADAADKASMPTITVSAMAMREDDGMRSAGGAVGISLPIFSGSVRHAVAAESAAVAHRAASERTLHERRKSLAIAQASARRDQIRANIRTLTNDVMPPVKEHVAAATVLFSQGKGDVASIVQSQRRLLDLEQSAIMLTEAEAQTDLAIEAAGAGFLDAALSGETPRLAAPAMADTSMGAMPVAPQRMRKARPVESQPASPRASDSANPSNTPRSGMPGMGM